MAERVTPPVTVVVQNSKVFKQTGPLTLIGAAAGFLFIYFGLMLAPANQLGASFRFEVALAVPLVFGFAFWMLDSLATVYQLRVSVNGVSVRYLLSSPFTLRWDQIVPPKFPFKLRGGGIAFSSVRDSPGVKLTGWGVSDGPGENMPMWMSKPMALAILQHPNCPRWQIRMEIWKSLGVNNPPPDMVSSPTPTRPL